MVLAGHFEMTGSPGKKGTEMREKIELDFVSRRKALSLLGLGAALGFTLSSALEPLEAEAEEAAAPAAAPAEPPEPTG